MDSTDKKIVSSDVPTPAFAYGDFFVLNKDRKTMLRVEPTSGEVKWQTTLDRNETYEASPLVADGKIYVVDHSGRVVVMDAENGDALHRIEMDRARDDPTRASIVAAAQGSYSFAPRLSCIASPSRSRSLL